MQKEMGDCWQTGAPQKTGRIIDPTKEMIHNDTFRLCKTQGY